MRTFTHYSIGTALLLCLFSSFAIAQSGAGGNYPVSDILPAKLVKELSGTIAPEASINDALATYTIKTGDGTEEVTGTANMLARVNELRAVETLEAMKKTDVYKDALKNSAKAPVEYGKALWNAPVDTMKDTARGLGGFLADVGYSVVSDDPSQDNVAKTGLGQSNARRAFAFELGVNPYSQYQPLQDALSEVSWTAVGGGLTVGVAFRAVQNTPGQVLVVSRIANTGRELVRDKSPRELKNRNEESLAAMGIEDGLIESMLGNFSYDPENETRLVVALEAMKGVEGREGIVALASLADSRFRAEQLRRWVELLASYHDGIARAEKVVVIAHAPYLIDKKGVAHGIFPTDYIVPTPDLEPVLTGITDSVKGAGYKPGPIFLTGAVHPDAKKILLSNGWSSVTEHAEQKLR